MPGVIGTRHGEGYPSSAYALLSTQEVENIWGGCPQCITPGAACTDHFTPCVGKQSGATLVNTAWAWRSTTRARAQLRKKPAISAAPEEKGCGTVMIGRCGNIALLYCADYQLNPNKWCDRTKRDGLDCEAQ